MTAPAVPLPLARHPWAVASGLVVLMLVAVVLTTDGATARGAAVAAGAAALGAVVAPAFVVGVGAVALFALPLAVGTGSASDLAPVVLAGLAAVALAEAVADLEDGRARLPALLGAAGVVGLGAAIAMGADPGVDQPWRLSGTTTGGRVLALVACGLLVVAADRAARRPGPRPAVVLAVPAAVLALAVAPELPADPVAVVAAVAALGLAAVAGPGPAGMAAAVSVAAAGATGEAALLAAGAALALALVQPAGAVAMLPGAAAALHGLASTSVDPASAAAVVAVAAVAGAALWRWTPVRRPHPGQLPALAVAAWLVVAPDAWTWTGASGAAPFASGAARAAAVFGLTLTARAAFRHRRDQQESPAAVEPVDLPVSRWSGPPVLALVAVAAQGLVGVVLVVSYLRLR